MILNSIIINNMRSYANAEVEFPRGITLFGGDIGSGKSTILMAVEFALFGFGKYDGLLAKKFDSGYVLLDFTEGGRRYEIRRALRRKDSSVEQDPRESWIKEDGQKELLSPSDLKQRVLGILGFNEPGQARAGSKIFRYAIYTPQEEMKDVLSPKGRLDTIRRAFGIEDYGHATGHARSILSRLAGRINVLDARIGDIGSLRSEAERLESEVSGIRPRIAGAERRMGELRDEEARKDADAAALRSKKNEMARLESRRSEAARKITEQRSTAGKKEAELKTYEAQLEENLRSVAGLQQTARPDTKMSVQEMDAEIARLRGMKDALIRLGTEKRGTEDDIARIGGELGKMRDADAGAVRAGIAELEDQGRGLDGKIASVGKNIADWKEKRVAYETERGAKSEEVSRFSRLGNRCLTCDQEITDGHRHDLIEARKSRIDALGEEIAAISESVEGAEAERDALQVELDSCRDQIVERGRILPRIEEYRAKLSEMERIRSEIDGAGGDDPGLGERISALETLKGELVRYQGAEERISQVRQEGERISALVASCKREASDAARLASEAESDVRRIDGQIGEFGDLDGQIRANGGELAAIRKGIEEASGTVAALKERLEQEARRLEECRKGIAESERLAARRKRLDQFAQWLNDFFIPTISVIEKQVLTSILHNFGDAYSRWCRMLIEDAGKESAIDEDFSPTVTQDGFDQKDAFLSGGERTSIALAYRLTLNTLMRREAGLESSLLILDEPTDGFSKNQLEKMRGILREIDSEQIILVSHEVDLESHADHVFHVFKGDGFSRITRSKG